MDPYGVAGGAAVVAAGVAIGLGVSVLSDHDEYMATNDTKRFDELEASIPDKVLASNVMWGATGALAATAVVLFFVEGRGGKEQPADDADEKDASAGWQIVPTVGRGAGLSLSTSF